MAKPVHFLESGSNQPVSVDPNRVARVLADPNDPDSITIIRLQGSKEKWPVKGRGMVSIGLTIIRLNCGKAIAVQEKSADVIKKLIIAQDGYSERKFGAAFQGKGYGTRRLLLQVAARDHIERSIREGFFCEAIAISESIISDRLESRLRWLAKDFPPKECDAVSNYRPVIGFWVLGRLIKWLRVCETDSELIQLSDELDGWRVRRNGALHEMVKVEDDGPVPDWRSRDPDWKRRMAELAISARCGYELVKRLYHRVADLNPKAKDRVFPYPERSGFTADPSDTTDRLGD